MGLLNLVVLCVVLPLMASALPPHQQYSGSKVYNVYHNDNIAILGNMLEKYDVWREPRQGEETFDVMVLPEDQEEFLQLIQDSGMYVEDMISDLGEAILSEKVEILQNRAKSGKNFNYNSYHTLSEIESWMADMERDNSDILSRIDIARSYEGRTITTFKLATGGRKPAIWIDGGIHSREWVSPSTMIYFVKYLIDGYRNNDPAVRDLVERADWYILPVWNVDGYEYTWQSDRLWRKTRSPNPGSSCVGCDPNRNWDYQFGGPGTSANPCANNYHGRFPFSEVEVKAVVDYIQKIPDLKSYWAYHSYGQMFMMPYGFTYDRNPDFFAQDTICRAGAFQIAVTTGVTYRCEALIFLVGPSSGSSVDYMYASGVKYSYGVELRDRGNLGFILPESQIEPTARESFAAMKVMAKDILDE